MSLTSWSKSDWITEWGLIPLFILLFLGGLLLGIASAQLGANTSFFNSNFYSAIIGAAVGGGISYLLQIQSLRAAKRERLADKRAREEILAHSLMIKAMRIAGNLRAYTSHIESSYASAPIEKHSDPFSFVKALVGNFDFIKFSDEELSYLISFKNPQLFSIFMELDGRHNSDTDILKMYRDARQTFLDTQPANMTGAVGTIELSAEEMRIYRPKMVSLNLLIEGLRIATKEDAIKADAAVADLTELLRPTGFFPFAVKRKLLPDEEKIEEAKAQQ